MVIKAVIEGGYSKDIAWLSDKQIHMNDTKTKASSEPFCDMGVNIEIDPEEFDEGTKFVIYFRKE